MEALEWLQGWYQANCDENWEHSYGVVIESLDNPGWSVSVDLSGTPQAKKNFNDIKFERTEDNWVHCRVQNNKFEGFGGSGNLKEIVLAFRHWCEAD